MANDHPGRDFDLDTIVLRLKEREVSACVEQTGGGTATILVGEPTIDSNGDTRYVVLCGPGWFAGPEWTHPRASTLDFYLSPDDDGENTDNVATIAATATDDEIVEAIVRVFEKERS